MELELEEWLFSAFCIGQQLVLLTKAVYRPRDLKKQSKVVRQYNCIFLKGSIEKPLPPHLLETSLVSSKSFLFSGFLLADA